MKELKDFIEDLQEVQASAVDDWTGEEYMGGDLKIPDPKSTFVKSPHEYNQKEVSGMSCTNAGNYTTVSNVLNVDYPLEIRKKLWETSKSLGASDSKGWAIAKATDVIRKEWNERNPDKKIVSFRENFLAPKFWEYANVGHHFVMGGYVSSQYWHDALDDGVLDEFYSKGNFGHCWSGFKKDDKTLVFVDNYPYRNHNSYEVKIDDAYKLKRAGTLFHSAYFFIDEHDMKVANGEIPEYPTWAKAAVEKYKDLFTNFDADAPVDMEQFQWLLKKSGLIESVAPVTQARALVILDKILS